MTIQEIADVIPEHLLIDTGVQPVKVDGKLSDEERIKMDLLTPKEVGLLFTLGQVAGSEVTVPFTALEPLHIDHAPLEDVTAKIIRARQYVEKDKPHAAFFIAGALFAIMFYQDDRNALFCVPDVIKGLEDEFIAGKNLPEHTTEHFRSDADPFVKEAIAKAPVLTELLHKPADEQPAILRELIGVHG